MHEFIKSRLLERGIKELNEIQKEAIKGLLEGRNILVCSPTGSGKTLIGELALVSNVLKGKKGIYTVPLRALANEKYDEFVKSWHPLRIEITTGDYDKPPKELERSDILITTYEKLDSILRQFRKWLKNIGAIVIDEIHLVNDDHRGPIIERLIALLRYYNPSIQIVGLSATIGNPFSLQKWLEAKLVYSDKRPVRLIEGYYDSNTKTVYFMNGRKIQIRDISDLVIDTLKDGANVLILSHSRKSAEKKAIKLADITRHFLSKEDRKALKNALEELRENRYEFEKLRTLISSGIAFHHAGLSSKSRRLLEQLFRKRHLKVISSTPTLAAGINCLLYTSPSPRDRG